MRPQIDEMGNKVGQLHVDRQDLGKLQARKFKGLKKGPKRRAGDDEGAEAGEGAEAQEEGAKRRKEE